MANGKLQEPNLAEAALNSNEGDFIAIAKGALADQKWPEKIAGGENPVPFNPGMIMPYATLDCNESFWANNPDGISREKIIGRDVAEGA